MMSDGLLQSNMLADVFESFPPASGNGEALESNELL